jgi:hypothetical protein
VRLTAKLLDIDYPVLIERGSFDGYVVGYEWRVYQEHHELGRWDAPEI